jgi:hypothetical protein
MKVFLSILAVACLIPVAAQAHGPSGQKVVKEFEVKAEPAKVWALLKDFGAIGKWHPDVINVKLEDRKDTESDKILPHRLVTLKNETTFLEKLREANDNDMKLDYKLVDGKESTIAVSNYRTVAQVKAGAAGQSIVTLTARFYNKANTMEAPPGADNPAANKAIKELYDSAATGLKFFLEK